MTHRNSISNAVERISFDMEDDKGREIGVDVFRTTRRIVESDWEMYGARVQSTRMGNRFGALQPVRYFSSEANREQFIAERVSGSKARHAARQVLR